MLAPHSYFHWTPSEMADRQCQRNARRRAEFLDKKLLPLPQRKSSAVDTTENKTCAFKCDQCYSNLKSENRLKIYVGKSHKKVNSTPATSDCPRQQRRSLVSLSASPAQLTTVVYAIRYSTTKINWIATQTLFIHF